MPILQLDIYMPRVFELSVARRVTSGFFCFLHWKVGI